MIGPEFDPERHRDFIARRGEQIAWLRSEKCACQDTRNGLRDRQCAVCGGVGFVYTSMPEVKQGATYPNGMGKLVVTGQGATFSIGQELTAIGGVPRLVVTSALACGPGDVMTLTVSGHGCNQYGSAEVATWTASRQGGFTVGVYELTGALPRVLVVEDMRLSISGDSECISGTAYVEGWAIDSVYRALVRQVNERKDFARFGQLYLGDITVTTMPDEMPVQEGDKVGLVTREFRRQDVIRRGDGVYDPLPWTPVARVLSVKTLDQEYLVDSAGDVRVSDDETSLRWLTATPPETGTRIAVVYDWVPQYIVVPSMVTKRRVVGSVEMSQCVTAKLMGREEFRQ